MLSLVLAATLQLDRVQHSLIGTYRHYQQYVNGVPVAGAERVEREVNGRTETVYDTSVGPPTSAAFRPIAAEVGGATRVYVIDRGALRLTRRVIVHAAPLEPYATYVDDETGEVIRREPLFWRATARVFEANPVVKLNNPSLQDQNNAATAVPDGAYSTVEINDLDPATPLSGPNARIIDQESPFTAHADPTQLVFDRSQPQFEEVNAYYHIDRFQQYLQSLGYTGDRRLVNYAIPIDAHGAEGTDNSYFIETGAPGYGSLFFGDGGTDDAEDPDLMIHEFGHAIQDWISPGTFGGANASESRALAEGLSDYWAFSQKYAMATASGRDPYCFADWDSRCGNDDPSQNCVYPPGADCLRRLDSAKTMADFERVGGSGTEHDNGAIWSSMLRQIFVQLVSRYGLGEGKRIADTLVIESQFGAPPNPTFAAIAKQMLDADRLLYAGANSDAICSAATQRGILSTCELLPKGELTFFQSPQQGIAIPDNDSAGIESDLNVSDTRDVIKLYVHVDIAHTARGDLRISVVAPDGTEVLLQDSSGDRSDDIRGTYGIDLMPAQPLDVLYGRPANGQWKLRVSDVLPSDTGTLLSWSLAIQFAGDQPSSTRPVAANQSLFVAAVAHAPGANNTMWRSDVRIMNNGSASANATLVFTPSGQDGNAQFGAVKIAINPAEVVALDDVVAELFQTVGTGQLQLITDSPDLVANARTYTNATHGTYGQFTAANGVDSVASDESPLEIALLENNDAFRANIGFAETSGNTGTVRVRLTAASNGELLSETTHAIAPFGHRQDLVPVTSDAFIAHVDVIAGAARVIAYGAVVDNRTGDPIYVPASRPPAEATTKYAPVISAAGAFGTHWTSDVWVTAISFGPTFINAATGERRQIAIDPAGPNSSVIFNDVAGFFGGPGSYGLLRAAVPPNALPFARTSTPGDGGSFGQFVPFRPATSLAHTVMPIESSYFFRTNIGLANLGDARSTYRIVFRDAGGMTIGSRDITLEPLQLAQFPIQDVIGSATLRSGSARVESVDAGSPFLFYGSVVDNSSGDAVHIAAQ